MSAVDDAQKILGIASHGLRALETIGELARGAGTGLFPDDKLDHALATLKTIGMLTDIVKKALVGQVSVDHIDDEIKKITTGLAQNDADARSAEDARFPAK